MNRLALALVIWLVAAGSALAARPGARCEAVQQGRRTHVRVEVLRFFDAELLRLVRLGLEGRVTVSAVLMRRRTAWFDAEVVHVEREHTLSWDKASRQYLFDGVAIGITDLDPLRLARIPLGRRDADTAGSHYVEVSVRLQVVTVSSLLSAVGWVTGDRDESVVTTQVVRAVAEDLTRKASTTCSVSR